MKRFLFPPEDTLKQLKYIVRIMLALVHRFQKRRRRNTKYTYAVHCYYADVINKN